jgi:uncharacterized protein (TIGR03435 family)
VLKTLLFIIAALLGLAARAQQPTAPKPPAATSIPNFEVATIKPTARADGSWRLAPTADGYTGMDISLLKLISAAYGVYDVALIKGGPSWIDLDKFDLEAKFDPAEIPNAQHLNFRQRSDMLQPLLADRFHLKVHWETRDFRVFNLLIAKDGPKLQPTKPEDVTQSVSGASCLFRRSRPGYIQVQGCLPKDLEDQLRYAAGRTVIDKTGIAIRSDFELRWAPEDAPIDSPAAAGPSIFNALQQQLGLKLVPATAPLKILVIDSAAKPSAN